MYVLASSNVSILYTTAWLRVACKCSPNTNGPMDPEIIVITNNH